MRQCRCLMVALVAAASFFAGSSLALAQSAPSLRMEVIMAPGTPNTEQQGQIRQYITHWMERLTSDDPAQVAEARRRLVNPFGLPGATEAFITTYSPTISRELIARRVIQHESVLVRTNAMIVASQLRDGGGVATIQSSLADAAPSVRYWGATTIMQVGGSLSQADQTALLEALTKLWQSEHITAVLARTLLAMDALRIPQATDQLLAALNHRVNIHAGDPLLPIRAEFEGLQGLTVRFFTQLTTPGQQVEPRTLNRLTLVLFRYLDLSTKLLQDKQPEQTNADDLGRIALIAGNYLPRMVQHLAPDARIDRLVRRQISPTDHAANRLLVEEWRHVLTAAPLNIPAAELVITPVRPDADQ